MTEFEVEELALLLFLDQAGVCILALGDGPPLAAHRDYLWRADGAGIAVLFPDGRPFHRFAPAGRAPASCPVVAPDGC